MLTPNLETISRIMRQETDRVLRNSHQSGKTVFCFQPKDVEGIYTQKKDVGMGIWFRLKDGRVFDAEGQAAADDPSCYGEAGLAATSVIVMERSKTTT